MKTAYFSNFTKAFEYLNTCLGLLSRGLQLKCNMLDGKMYSETLQNIVLAIGLTHKKHCLRWKGKG